MAFLLHRTVALNGVQVSFEKSKATIMMEDGVTDGVEVLLLTFKASNPKVHWLAQGFGGIPYLWFRSNSPKIPLLAELCKTIQTSKAKKARECKCRDAVVQLVLRGKTLLAKNSFKAATLAFRPPIQMAMVTTSRRRTWASLGGSSKNSTKTSTSIGVLLCA
jgi:hypothetical protein